MVRPGTTKRGYGARGDAPDCSEASVGRRVTAHRVEVRTTSVELRVMDRDAAEALLRRHHVGRMAFTHHDRVRIQLVNYVFADEWIYARIEAGEGFVTLRHNPWIAFEVDGIDDWRTVTVHGSVHFLLDPSASVTPAAPAVGRV